MSGPSRSPDATDSAAARPRFESRAADWLPPGRALQVVLAEARPLAAEPADLDAALWRVLAEPLSARATLPPWDNSAMDGYAVRADDVAAASVDRPVRLRVAGRVLAGDPAAAALEPGSAVRIMTGAPLPPGADAVVRVEDTDAEDGAPGMVAVRASVDPGRYVRPAGEDVREGEPVLDPGRVISPGVVAVAAALGRTQVRVHRRPTVAVLTTGSELRAADRYEDVRRGRGVPESNGPMLAAMIRDAGGVPLLLGTAADDRDDLRVRLAEAEEADLLITVGGASMGEADLVKRVLDELGYVPRLWRVRMRPGSPFGFGTLPRASRAQPVFGLPGNPASAFVTFELFVRPFILRLLGHARVERGTITCESADELSGPEGLTAYLRVRALPGAGHGGAARVALTGPQGSGLVKGLSVADGLAVLPEGVGTIGRGARVDVIPLVPTAFRPGGP